MALDWFSSYLRDRCQKVKRQFFYSIYAFIWHTTRVCTGSFVYHSGRSRGGGGQGVGAPPLFLPNTLQSPLHWLKFTQKILGAIPQNPGRPPFLQILELPLYHSLHFCPGLSHHLYIDDTRDFTSLPSENAQSIQRCVMDVFDWMTQAKLILSPSKNKLLLIGNSTNPYYPPFQFMITKQVGRTLGSNTVIYFNFAGMNFRVNPIFDFAVFKFRVKIIFKVLFFWS